MVVRKLFLLLVAICVSVSFAVADFTIDWADSVAPHTLYDSSAVNVGTTAGTAWLFQLVVDPLGDTSVSSMISGGQWQIGGASANGASEDTVLSTGNWNVLVPGVLGAVSSSYLNTDGSHLNENYYFRFFDASTEGSATYAGFIYDTVGATYVMPALAGPELPTAPDSYSVGLDRSGNVFLGGTTDGVHADGWAATIAVPEPGTMALFAIGMLTVAARRRRK